MSSRPVVAGHRCANDRGRNDEGVPVSRDPSVWYNQLSEA
jgi:hypothetical protein